MCTPGFLCTSENVIICQSNCKSSLFCSQHLWKLTLCQNWLGFLLQILKCALSSGFTDWSYKLYWQNRRGTYFIINSWSACRLIHLMHCWVFPLLLMFLKLLLCAGIYVIISIRWFVWMYRVLFSFLHLSCIGIFFIKSCRIIDS